LREQVDLMAEEMAANQRHLEEIKVMLRSSARSVLNTGSSNTSEGELEMSVLQADREVLQDTLSGVRSENRRLLDEVVKLKVQLKRVKKERDFLYSGGAGTDRPEPLGKRKSAPAAKIFGPIQELQPMSPSDATSTCSTTVGASSEVSPIGLTGRWSGAFESMMEEDVKSRLVALEHQVHTALEELVRKDQQLAAQKEDTERIQMMGREVAKQLKALAEENEQLKEEHGHLELQNNRLQGYLLDGMAGEELNKLIYNLTSAAERVRLSVQLRKIQTATSPGSGHDSNKESSDDAV
jgi:chromosome segregation ATPase